MAKSFRVSSQKAALTSVGLMMFLGFAGLGFGWNSLESIWLDSSWPDGFGARKHAIKPPDATEEALVRAIPLGESPEYAHQTEFDQLTPEEEEQNRLEQLAQTHAVTAFEYLDNGRYRKAISEAKKAIKINPQNFDAYDVRDRAYKKLGIHQKKREVMVRGVICDLSGEPLSAGMTKKERREFLSEETDLSGMGITGPPSLEGL